MDAFATSSMLVSMVYEPLSILRGTASTQLGFDEHVMFEIIDTLNQVITMQLNLVGLESTLVSCTWGINQKVPSDSCKRLIVICPFKMHVSVGIRYVLGHRPIGPTHMQVDRNKLLYGANTAKSKHRNRHDEHFKLY